MLVNVGKTDIEIGGQRYRLRRLDPRNLVIERRRPDGLWLIAGYYGNPRSLANGLLDLAATLPDDQAGDVAAATLALAEAVERNTARIVAALHKQI
jgi:hypothetical protein